MARPLSKTEAEKIYKNKKLNPGSVTPSPSLLLVKPGSLNSAKQEIKRPSDIDVPLETLEYVIIDGSHRFESTKMLVDRDMGGDWDKLKKHPLYFRYWSTPCQILVGVSQDAARLVSFTLLNCFDAFKLSCVFRKVALKFCSFSRRSATSEI